MKNLNVSFALTVLFVCCYFGAEDAEKCYACIDGDPEAPACKNNKNIMELPCHPGQKCFSLVSDKGNDFRGCIEKDVTCEMMKGKPAAGDDEKVAECYTCDENLCNKDSAGSKKNAASEKVLSSSLTFVTVLLFMVV